VHINDQTVDADGQRHQVSCDVIAGCDGFHGICRPAMPAGLVTVAGRAYPYAWLGILADVPPSTDELIYCRHADGFALHSMRSLEISRLYLQVPPDDDIAAWPDDRIWAELRRRFKVPGWELKEGPILEKSVIPMRSFVAAPMRSGRLFLAGDAAHIVPPTGAKGLNLALADVAVLADALVALAADTAFRTRSSAPCASPSEFTVWTQPTMLASLRPRSAPNLCSIRTRPEC
jgi:p-hydroxybenzoate 3-monooxygenase